MITEDKILQAAIDYASPKVNHFGSSLYESYKEAFIRGAEWALEQSGWTSIAEHGMPPEGTRCRAWDGFSQYDALVRNEDFIGTRNDVLLHGMTFYFVIPSPPKT